MLNERPSVDRSLSGISHRVAPEPDVIARDRPSGAVNLANGETVRLDTIRTSDQAKLDQYATECGS